VSTESIAREIAGKWGLAGSTNLVQWALLLLLIGMLASGAGTWYVRGRIADGQVARAQLKTKDVQLEEARSTAAAAARQIEEDRKALALAATDRVAMVAEYNRIRQDYINDRAADRRETQRLQLQLETALAARPDLRAVRVGPELLQAWNDANRGRASGSAGADAAARPSAGRVPQAVPRQPAAGQQR
jgi:hypothetical protein